jgi:uncharacterized protein involved in outer membrane biogenesis
MDFARLLKKTWLRRLLWTVGVLLLIWMVAGLTVPPLVKSQVQARASQALGRTVTVGALHFKPWTLELAATDLALASADGKTSQLTVGRLALNASIQSLWRLAPVLDAVTIERPHAVLTRRADGRTDLDDLLQRFATAPDAPPSKPVHFALYNLVLTDGEVDFADHAVGGKPSHQLRKLQLALPFVSNFDSQRDVTVQPHLAFELDGSGFDSSAQATPFATNRKGEVQLHISRLDLAPYAPYLPASVPVRLRSAVLDSTLTLAFEQKPTTAVRISGTVKLSGVRLDDKAGAEWLAVDSAQAVVKELRPLEQMLALESLEVDGPKVQITRNRNGGFNLPGRAGASADAGIPSVATAPKPGVSQVQPIATQATPGQDGWKVSLERFTLQGGQVRLTDESVAPAHKLALTDTRLRLDHVQWPMARPTVLEASTKLQVPGTPEAQSASLVLAGEGTDKAGTVKAYVSNLGLSLAAPYLAQGLLPRARGVLEAEATAQWKGGDVQVQTKRITLQDFALTPPAGKTDITAKELPTFRLLEVSDVVLDWPQRAATVGKLNLHAANVRVARGDDGRWMYEHWLRSTTPPAAAVKPVAPQSANAKVNADAPRWRVALAEAALTDSTVSWVDRVPDKTAFLELSALQARMKNLTLDGKTPMPLVLSAKVRSGRVDPGALRFEGALAWSPLLARGTLTTRQFPAQALAPYAMDKLRLQLQRADTSFKGQVRYASRPGGPELEVRGDAAIEELQLNSLNAHARTTTDKSGMVPTVARQPAMAQPGVSDSEELLRWKALSAPGIVFSMAPGAPLRLTVRELSLADFFARLIINPEGRLVLQELVSTEDRATAKDPQVLASAVPPVADPATAALAPVVDIGPIHLVNGQVAFSDRFIQPHYSADLSELSGSMSHFSSQPGSPLADLELRGRAEGTASLEITGKLNPLVKPLELNIHGKVRDLELSPLSSYAIKYAGYGIERGKLSVDVNYAVAPDGQLQASNKLVLNQLVLGDEVPGANHLPVKLALSLLADRNGVVDLDLPLSGSLNDPEFRVWPIVWRMIGNLIAKALTSPFHLISGSFSGGEGGDELSNVAFEPGTDRISAAAQPGLDQVAKALQDKPAFRVTLVGTASLEREAQAIRRDQLNMLLLAEKRRAAASAAKDVTAVSAVTAEETPTLLKEVYRRSSVKKPRNLIGMAKDLGADEMETLLLAHIPVDEDTVRTLAQKRALVVREYLTQRQLPSERLFMGAANTTPTQDNWQPRVELSLEQD